jgi:hypothetical protein
VDQIFAGCPRKECPDNIGVSGGGQLSTLLGEAPDVLMESFIRLLSVHPKVLRVARAHVSALTVPHKDMPEVGPGMDFVGREMLQPGSR